LYESANTDSGNTSLKMELIRAFCAPKMSSQKLVDSPSPSPSGSSLRRRRVRRVSSRTHGSSSAAQSPSSPSNRDGGDDDGSRSDNDDNDDDNVKTPLSLSKRAAAVRAAGVGHGSEERDSNDDDDGDSDDAGDSLSDGTIGTVDNDDGGDVDETDVGVWKRRYEQQRSKWLAATVTIQSLIEQFTEYKHTVDEEKASYEERLAAADKLVRQEKAKNARTNQETIANLKTLMLELEIIENKNQELHEELQQERVDHERTLAQMNEAREARDDLEQDVQELTRELQKSKDAALKPDFNNLLSVRSGGSRVTPRAAGTMRPVRPVATPGRGASAANRFSTMRAGDVGVVDLSAEVRLLKQQKAELREQLEAETKKHVEVLSLLNQLNVVMGVPLSTVQQSEQPAAQQAPPSSASLVVVPTISISSVTGSAAAAAAASAAATTTTTVAATTPAGPLTPVRGVDKPKTSGGTERAAPAPASKANSEQVAKLDVGKMLSQSAGSVIYRRDQATQTFRGALGGGDARAPSTPSTESAAVRLRQAITKISAAGAPTLIGSSLSARSQQYVCDDPAYETQLAGVSGRVTQLLQVGASVWVGCGNGQIDIFAADTHSRLSTIQARSSAISQLALAGEHVWLAATDGGVSIYSFGGALVETLAAHSAKVMGIVSVDKCVWTCGADMTIRVWHNAPPFRCRKEVQLQNLMLSVICHLGIVWIGTESVISRWNAQTYRRLDTLDRKGKSMHCVNALVSVSENVWSLSGDNVIGVWSPQGEQLKSIEVAQRMIGLFACGAQVWVSSTSDVFIYDASAAPVRQVRRPHVDTIRAVLLVAVDGRERVWSGASDRTVVVWRLPSKADQVPTDAQHAAADAALRSSGPANAALATLDANSLDTEAVLLALKDPVLGLRIQTKKIGFGRSKPNAFTARELIDWVLTSLPQIERRPDAVLLARRLHAEGHLQSAQGDEIFRDGNRVWQYGAGFRFIMPEAEQKKLALLPGTSQRSKDAVKADAPPKAEAAASSKSDKSAAKADKGKDEAAAAAAKASERPTHHSSGTNKSLKKSGGGTKKRTAHPKPAEKAPVAPEDGKKTTKKTRDRRETIALDSSPVSDAPARTDSSSGGSRRIRTTGSQLVRHVSQRGGSSSGGSNLATSSSAEAAPVDIDIKLGTSGTERRVFAVPPAWTLAKLKVAIERVWGVQPTYSLYVMKPNSDEVIGLMTPELNPHQTVLQLREEGVVCEWHWRETRSEDWEDDDAGARSE
jgi:hypothetical protein